jgi:Uma2 family endonuclease
MQTPAKLQDLPAWAAANPAALPTMRDLPHEDPEEPGLPDEFHGLQPQLLAEALVVEDYAPNRIFSASDLNLYYDPTHTGWYKRPDWFLVVGHTSLYREQSSRSSYVMWDEQAPPSLVIEFLSPGTEAEDLGPFYPRPARPRSLDSTQPPSKFTVYEQILQVPHYICFDAKTLELRYFQLDQGRYQEQSLNPRDPKIWMPDLKLGLGLWQGQYRHLTQSWLRWCNASGNWLPTATERERAAKEAALADREAALADREAALADREAERAAKEMERAAKEEALAQRQKLANYLRSLGVDPENLPPMM